VYHIDKYEPQPSSLSIREMELPQQRKGYLPENKIVPHHFPPSFGAMERPVMPGLAGSVVGGILTKRFSSISSSSREAERHLSGYILSSMRGEHRSV
jgi:hypothetical protein